MNDAAHDQETTFMTVLRLEHIGIVVDDLAAATAFFAALVLEVEGEASVEGGLVDRINGLEGVWADVVILRTPDGNGKVELAKYRAPAYDRDDGSAPANAPGIRHILFAVETSRRPSPVCEGMAASWSRVGELREQLLALLRARAGGDHRRAGGEDRLTAAARRAG